MAYPLFNFTGQTQQDPSQNLGLQQYLTQGQMGINPGQVQQAASDPIAMLAQGGFGKALQQAAQQGPQANSYTPSAGNPNMGYDSQSAVPSFGTSVLNQLGVPQPGFDQAVPGQGMGGPSVQQLMLAQGLMGNQYAGQ